MSIEIVKANAIPALVSLLKLGSAVGKQTAATALTDLATTSTAAKAAIVEAKGAIPALIKALKTKEAVGGLVKAQAGTALAALAYKNSQGRRAIKQANGVARLLSLLKSSTSTAEEKSAATHALKYLNTDDAEVHAAIDREESASVCDATIQDEEVIQLSPLGSSDKSSDAELASIPRLVRAIASRNLKQQERVVERLMRLTYRNGPEAADVVKAGGIKLLVKLLRSKRLPKRVAKAQATNILANVAWNSPARNRLVMKAGAAPLLIEMVQKGVSSQHIHGSLTAMITLAGSSRSGRRIATYDNGAIRVWLVQKLKLCGTMDTTSRNARDRKFCRRHAHEMLQLVGNLADHVDTGGELGREGFIQTIAAILVKHARDRNGSDGMSLQHFKGKLSLTAVFALYPMIRGNQRNAMILKGLTQAVAEIRKLEKDPQPGFAVELLRLLSNSHAPAKDGSTQTVPTEQRTETTGKTW